MNDKKDLLTEMLWAPEHQYHLKKINNNYHLTIIKQSTELVQAGCTGKNLY